MTTSCWYVYSTQVFSIYDNDYAYSEMEDWAGMKSTALPMVLFHFAGMVIKPRTLCMLGKFS